MRPLVLELEEWAISKQEESAIHRAPIPDYFSPHLHSQPYIIKHVKQVPPGFHLVHKIEHIQKTKFFFI